MSQSEEGSKFTSTMDRLVKMSEATLESRDQLTQQTFELWVDRKLS